ncbi:MAG: glycosyltransferase family 4 protein [Fimbriimonadales bacterium]|nr:glycosyltransferase family 4 protein [Fimbriimonadales bacterium]
MPERSFRVLQIISSSRTSGAERHVINLAELLVRLGHQVEVLCPPGEWLPQTLRASGVPVREQPMRKTGWFRTLGCILRTVRRDRVDVIHTHLTRGAYFGYLAGLLRGVPVVASVHIATRDRIYRRVARGSNRVIAVSNYVRGTLFGQGVPERFIDTVYNGTDFDRIAQHDPRELREELRLSAKSRLIGLIGRVSHEKGHLEMVRAMSEVRKAYPEAHILFVGRVCADIRGDLEAELDSASLRDHVHLLGERSDVARILDSVEFSTLPSRKEAFGIAAIEAMARSRAVLATRIGGLPEVVRHGSTGLLVDLRPDQLAEAMVYLLDHPADTQEMGRRGRLLVQERFTLDRMVERTLRVYEKAVGS